MGQIGYSSCFAFQSSWDNIELFLPADPSGFWHCLCDGKNWLGGNVHGAGAGRIKSLAVWESRYKEFDDSDHGNFELLALQSNHLLHWHRDNDDPFEWHTHTPIPNSLRKTSLALCRLHVPTDNKDFWEDEDDPKYAETFYAIAGNHDQGLRMYVRSTESLEWDNGAAMMQLCPNCTEIGGGQEPIQGRYIGLGWVHGTSGTEENFHEAKGRPKVVATRADGALILFDAPTLHGEPNMTLFRRAQKIWNPQDVGKDIRVGATGRPCIIQTDRGYSSPDAPFIPLPHKHGNYEVFVPAITGGIVHFWHDPNGDNNPWSSGGAIGRAKYDEVAAVQDRNMSEDDVTGRIHLFGWKRGEPAFDHFVHLHREDGFYWKGPQTIQFALLGTVLQPVPA